MSDNLLNFGEETDSRHQFTVVIVDDSAFSRNLLNQMLTEKNIKVVGLASSAQEAIGIIKEKKPSLVICDIVMPQMSGIDLAKKANELDLGSIFIMMSSLSHEHIILEAISAGAVDFLQKPIQPNQLFDAIEKVQRQKKD